MTGRAATLALAGDTMLGRKVGDALLDDPDAPLVESAVAARIAQADAFVLNLECCVSDRGSRWPDPHKPFFFRAPPVAARRLRALGVDAVTLANNHSLDYDVPALLDTLAHLRDAGIAVVGAGVDEAAARAPRMLRCGDLRLRLVGLSDHPREYAAAPGQPGIAYADLDAGLPEWAREAAAPGPDADIVIALAHWGPNMVPGPVEWVLRAARALVDAGVTLVAGHSAHVFHGAAPAVLYDLGDFLDDYAVDRELRNDLGLLWLVDLEPGAVRRIRAIPLALDYCFTRTATPDEALTVERLLRERCAPLDTEVVVAGEGELELVVTAG
jgi:poly-gamma-glutamate capsule biosynthesis protein CapA/YwtB (metallophosphatase superfamily)